MFLINQQKSLLTTYVRHKEKEKRIMQRKE